jgi:hypothetical protein
VKNAAVLLWHLALLIFLGYYISLTSRERIPPEFPEATLLTRSPMAKLCDSFNPVTVFRTCIKSINRKYRTPRKNRPARASQRPAQVSLAKNEKSSDEGESEIDFVSGMNIYSK